MTDLPVDLAAEQEKTLASGRRRYGALSRILFLAMDLFYGRKRTLSKFKVLEVVARVPYQAWEHVAYIAITHTYGSPSVARRTVYPGTCKARGGPCMATSGSRTSNPSFAYKDRERVL